MRCALIISVMMLCNLGQSWAQDSTAIKSEALSLDFLFWQFKDTMNYGLVYSGPGLAIAYSFEINSKDRTFIYSPEVNLGVNFNKGIGIAYGGSPADLYYGYEVLHRTDKRLTIGPYSSLNYNWQLYPELQSGHMFWYTTIELGPRAIFTLPINEQDFKIDFAFAIAGWASRPKFETESHFYSLRFKEYVGNAHENLKFGSTDLFSHIDLQVEKLCSHDKRLSLAYGFSLFGYHDIPKLDYLDHSITLKWKLGKL